MLAVTTGRPAPRKRLPTCISFSGALDAFTAPEALSRIETIVAESPAELVVDLARLALIDSVGVRALVTLTKLIGAQGGKIVFIRATGQPRLVLDLLKTKLGVVLG